MKSNYKRLGDYIRQVDERNIYGKVTRLLGVSIEKRFIESIANTVGTDMDIYKIVKNNQFAYGPVTSRNGDKISVALLKEKECIISSSYSVFKVINEKELLPDYLMLWFRRPEFDRYARYHSHGSTREIFNWDAMCDVMLPIPDIAEQQKIVDAYNVIENRIALKRKINDNLEAQALAIFDNLSAEHSSWDDGTIKDLGEIISGATPSTKVNVYFTKSGIAWITPRDTTSQNRKFTSRGATDITELGYKSCSTRLMPSGSVLFTSRAPIGCVTIALNELCTNQGFKSIIPFSHIGTAFVYCFLKLNAQLIESYGSGTTFLEVSTSTLKSIPIKVPPKSVTKELSRCCKPIFYEQALIENEIGNLQEIKMLLLARLAN